MTFLTPGGGIEKTSCWSDVLRIEWSGMIRNCKGEMWS
jgi:hypothetical protein